MEKYPNWVEMPQELMSNILQRLGAEEILNSARKVCTTWRSICKNPEMWKVIVIHRSLYDWDMDFTLRRLTKQAVDLSCGELIGISLKYFATDDLLDHIVLRSSKLKRLFLMRCYHITSSGLSRAVKRLPLLEDLYISQIDINTEHIKVIGRSCPQLTTFIVPEGLIGTSDNCDNNAFAIANNMPGLRRLQLFDKEMTNIGLLAILNGCPHLECLHIRMCYNVDLDENLRKLCMERIKDFKFYLYVQRNEDYDFDDGMLSSKDVDLSPDYYDD